MSFERNLVIVHTPGRQALSDFLGVTERIASKAPDIETFIVRNGLPHSVMAMFMAWEGRALTAGELQAFFQATRGRFGV